MKASEVRVGQLQVVEVRPSVYDDFRAEFRKHGEISLRWSDVADETLLYDGQQTWSVCGVDGRSDEVLREVMEADLPRLCTVAAVAPQHGITNRLIVEIRSFATRYVEATEVSIAVTEAIVEEMVEKRLVTARAQNLVDQALKWLGENVVVRSAVSSPDLILVSGGELSGPVRKSQFRIYGNRIAVDVELGTDGRWNVVRLVRGGAPPREDQRPVFLVEGTFAFIDASVAAEIRRLAPTILDSLRAQASTYVGLWKHYNELERSIVIRRAKQFGWLSYDKCFRLPDGRWRFCVSSRKATERVLEQLQEAPDIDLEAARCLPSEYQEEDEAAEEIDGSPPSGRQRAFSGQCVGVDLARGTVDLHPMDVDTVEKPEEPGVLYIALHGDQTKLDRRQTAYRRLGQFTGKMPQLLMLLEGQNYASRARKAKPVNRAQVTELLGGNPTERQMDALEAALRTPDIALIQGPPGTGKTRVIAALQALLADEGRLRGIGGRILLTSYQHDAVDTAAASTTVLGLPPIRVGGRAKRAAVADAVDAWVHDCSRAIRTRLESAPQPPVRLALRQVRELTKGYVTHPGSLLEAAELLNQVFDIARWYVSPETTDQLLQLIQRMGSLQQAALPVDYEERLLLERASRGLRTDAISFEDDGVVNAFKLLRRLEQVSGVICHDDRETLNRAANCVDEPSAELLNSLEQVQEKLLDRLCAAPATDRAALVNADIERALTETISELHAATTRSYGGVDNVLFEFANDLENNPAGVRATIEGYSSVFAATCQQSVGFAMQQLKGDPDLEFDTVIVDEAARANPLDLFVPMVRATDRIILVGDHRQLPHILEPEVERELELSEVETQSVLRESLFQRLFTQLSKRVEPGAPVRTVTLNQQYRMHPVLGEFVSRVFYEPYDEGFASPRPESDFVHGVPDYAGKVAVWADLPRSFGSEEGSQSKSRRREAMWAAKEAKRILELCPNLSVGIITFYAAQEKELQRWLVKEGLANETDGRFAIVRKWGIGEDRDGRQIERFRVGTVDSFQGKEFDVVILSLTRCNDLPARSPAEVRKKYGFLTLENRLCVAMSRQKRLLVVVGDSAMVTGETAKGAVPALRAFYDLCGGDYGARI